MNQNDVTLDKRVVYINSSNATFVDQNNFDFFYNLLEPIRDVVYIKLMKAEVILNPSLPMNGKPVEDSDPIFINLKNYNRLFVNVASKNISCFEYISLNMIEKYGYSTVPNKFLSFKNEYTATGCTINDTNTFVVNPIDATLNRFDIQLYDKEYVIIPKNSIKAFIMVLCIYSQKKKMSMT
jgi:hypothetical protein